MTHHHLPHTWEVLYIKLYPLNTARLLSILLHANTVRRKEKNMGTAAFIQQNLSTFNMHRYRCSLICLTKCSQIKTIFQLFIVCKVSYSNKHTQTHTYYLCETEELKTNSIFKITLNFIEYYPLIGYRVMF